MKQDDDSRTAGSASVTSGRWQHLKVLRWEVALLVLVVLLIGITRFSTLDNKLLEASHAQRQTQTAIQTVVFHETGIDFLRPEIPVLGYPWAVPLEFPLFQAVASLPMAWGIPADVANRSTALGFFVITALLLWWLVRLVSDRRIAAVALVVFSFSPFAILWSRASLVEFLATAGALAWIISIIHWLDSSRLVWVAWGIVAGSVATSVKVTTALPWLVVAISLLIPETDRLRPGSWVRRFLSPGTVAVVVIPLLAGLQWTRHADSVKSASPVTRTLTSEGLRGWQTGTLAQRLDFSNLATVFDRISDTLIGPGVVLLIVAALAIRRRNQLTWISFALVPLVAAAVFFNLYLVHDYYLAAVSPALAALVALAIVMVGGWLPREWGEWRFVGLVVVWLGLTLALSHSYWGQAYEPDRGAPPEAVEIAALTDPGDLVMVGGIDWDPRVLYYAQRRGLMLYEPFVTREFAASLPDLEQYRALYLAGPLSHLAEWAALRPWYSPVSANTLLLGSTLADLGDVELAATPLDRNTALGEVSVATLDFVSSTIVCDGVASITIPSGEGSVWASVRSEGEARVVMADGAVPVSSESRTLVWQSLPGTTARHAHEVRCINEGVVHFDSLVEVIGGS